MTDDNEDMCSPALQTAASPPLTPLTEINSCFHLLQCIFRSAPPTLLQVSCSASLQGCSNWNNFTLAIQMLNSDSPGIPPTSRLENLGKDVLPCREGLLALSQLRYVTEQQTYLLYKRQMRTISDMKCLPDQI